MIKNLFFFSLLICGISTWAQNSFPQNIVIDDSYNAPSVSVATHVDLDNDSRADILAADYRKIFWMRNVSTQQHSFSPIQSIYTHTSEVLDVKSADLNYDGFKDIIFRTSTGIFMMTGSGNLGTFSAPIQMNSGTYTQFQILDVDSDGFLDIYFQSQLVAGWKKNSGTGTFPATITIFTTATGGPSIAIFKDLDGDNKMDLVTKAGYFIRWYKNDGTGVFTLKETVESSAIGEKIEVGDIDGDGDQDLLFYYENGNTVQFRWYRNTDALGNFSAMAIISNAPGNPNGFAYNVDRHGIKMFDVDMDGKEDIVYRVFWLNNVVWRKNLGNATFGTDQIITDRAKGSLDFNFADFDQDGKPDVYSLSTLDSKISWYQNLGAGNFGLQKALTYGVNFLNSIASGDIDGDGDIDILSTSNGDSKMSWYQNTDGLGTFSGPQIVINDSTIYPMYAQLLDSDNDGDNDFVVKYQYEVNYVTYYRISIFKNDGSGNFTEQILANTLPKDVIGLAVADIDNDGDSDLVAAYQETSLMKFVNNGSGNFSSPTSFFSIANKYPLSLKTLDMDNDGDYDVLATYNNKEIEWYENTDGLGNFSTNHIVVTQMHYPTDATNADVDGDGDVDVLFVNYFHNEAGWFQNNGNGTYTKRLVPGTVNHPRSIIAYDIDGDGLKDIVTNTFPQPKLRWYKNLGSGNLGTAQLVTNNIGRVRDFTIADYNGDGKPDFAAGSDVGEDGNETNMIVWFETGAAYQNNISGKVRFDEDNNGCSPADIGASMVMVKTQNAQHSYATFTNALGAYSLVANQSQFTTSVSSPLPDYTVSPQSQVQNFTSLGETQNADFCLIPNSVFKNLEVSIYPLDVARPGFATSYKIVISNKGSQKVSGQIVFNFNYSKMNFVSSNTAPDSQSTGNLYFNYTDLSPFHSKTIELKLLMHTIPTTNIGDVLEFTATAQVPQDITPADNTFVLKQNVVGSYDPNEIQVLEGPQILLSQKDDYLHYVIRFQNTGNYHAQRVRVKNILDAHLDWSTLTLESYSHPNRAVVTNGNNVEFIFDAIYLPGTNDEPNSHGYIAYKIKPKSNVVVGDIFTNTAEIFFDYNPAIVTNTVHTEIVNQVLSTASASITEFTIYPNPTTGMVYIKSSEKIKKITVQNAIGQQVLRNENQPEIDLSHLPTGVYIVTVESGNNVHTSKVIRK
ncbi:MAG: T9SS type A sorting domain-containing protein [Kaistella sp.]|nr:T9SS type A sorting domain-containing protein [Kaistella sp.]